MQKLLLVFILFTAQVALAGPDEVLAKFQREESENCDAESETLNRKKDLLVHELGTPEYRTTLYRVPCTIGAYNINHVWYLEGAGRLSKLSFAEPFLSERTMKVIGVGSTDLLTNSSYDPRKREIVSFEKWRGTGDASSSGVWRWSEGAFKLVKYTVDTTFDKKVNPRIVMDLTKVK